MSYINKEFDTFNEDEVEELDNCIILTDDDGNEVSFEFIDSIDYDGHDYAVLLPFESENNEDDGELVILEVVEDENDAEMVSFISVEDENVLDEVFKIFKERYADEFNFED